MGQVYDRLPLRLRERSGGVEINYCNCVSFGVISLDIDL